MSSKLKHVPTEAQEKAFDAVVKAIQAAKKKGLVFYGKCSALVAYTKHADTYIEDELGFDNSLRGMGSQVPFLSKDLLADSGADDYGHYPTEADERKYTEE